MAYRLYSSKRNKVAQQAIGDALIELLKELPFAEVTIKLICERAGVSRPTFYRHFDATEDVCGFYAAAIFRDISDELEGSIASSPDRRQLIYRFFQAMQRHHQLFDLLRENHLLAALFGHLWILATQHSMGIAPVDDRKRSAGEQAVGDFTAFITGGVYSLAFVWIMQDMSRDIAEMTDAVLRVSHDASEVLSTLAQPAGRGVREQGER
ncbi:regulatory protein TetR [Coriobacterium glomerans PW2]|uniref:Regulatory protein TetR n=1 Tax=Coriobacterium glomerans (strain ATCC 49209 / DSM 20642 / JCM 10262 / PW2) TaxID=700015 RepID=F2NA44_CORGP|nr:regulatory protein TetR [Coriobacterium glomerans PW2]